MQPILPYRLCLLLLFFCLTTSLPAQWVDWREATDERLVLSTVANSDDEEKDFAQADLDQDGWTDVIVVRKEPFSEESEGPKSDLLLMNVNGQLIDQTAQYAPEFLSDPSFARDLYIGDMDADGWPDVIIANTFGQQPRYYHNLGNDTDGNWLGLADESATRFPLLTGDDILFCAVWAGDIDGDAAPDLYFCNYKVNGGGGIAKDYLLLNDGTGNFTDESEARLGDLRNSAFGTAVQMADMDNDGDQDIIKVSTLFSVPPWGDNGVLVLFNENGYFDNWQNLSGTNPYMIEIADYDQNGWMDVFVVDDNTDYVIKNQGAIANNSISFSTELVGGNGFGGNVHAADLDGDGYLEVAVSDVDIPPCNSGRRFTIYRNYSGTLSAGYTNDYHPWSDNSYDFSFLDINNDGLTDFLSGSCDQYYLFMNDECGFATQVADFDADGIEDVCDLCPTNPDPDCNLPPDYPTVSTNHTIARQWNELLLASIRRDFARPTVHARNLFHTSIAMWDAWALYEPCADTYLLGKTIGNFASSFTEFPIPADAESARHATITYAAYRLLSHRFTGSPQAAVLQEAYDAHMTTLGYDITLTSTDYTTGDPIALGNYIAEQVIAYGMEDGANELGAYENLSYAPINPPLIVELPGNPDIEDMNRWQPLTLELFIDQSGNPIPGDTPDFLSPEWGQVTPFALTADDRTTYQRDSFDYQVYHDPGAPPYHAMDGSGGTEDYQWAFSMTAIWSAHLDPTDGVLWDISPKSIGNRPSLPTDVADYPDFYNYLDGGTASQGHAVNPATGQAYAENWVPRGDYARVLAEFWADGPESETPPGHWFTILNYVSDHPNLIKRYQGAGELLDNLEWDVKSYFILGGAMHDAAISAWGIKGWYDYIRPVSAIRAMADLGQSSDPTLPNFHAGGLPLVPGYIELIEMGDPLTGTANEHLHKLKLKAWRGHTAIDNTDTDEAGVDWIRAENWEPYQRPTFISPPFAGYVSGHSTYSRAAAEVLKAFTGDAYFPGGMGRFSAGQDEFLVFEDGPSIDIELQWATYQDAADESALSRIWGGIHPPIDDIPGRLIGREIGLDAFTHGDSYFYVTPQVGVGIFDSNDTWGVFTDNAPMSFGLTPVNAPQPPTRELVVFNTGDLPLTFPNDPPIQAVGEQGYAFVLDLSTLPTAIAPGDSAVFTVQFQPDSAGVFYAPLFIRTSDCDDPLFRINLSGLGATPELAVDGHALGDPQVVAYPAGTTLDVGLVEVDSSAVPYVLQLSNTANVPLHVQSISVLGPNAAAFTVDQSTLPPVLDPDQMGEITVDFVPTHVGNHIAALRIVSDAGADPVYTIPLRGSGGLPQLEVSREATPVLPNAVIDLGDVLVSGTGLITDFTLTNAGQVDLVLDAVEIVGAHATDFSLTTSLPTDLAAGTTAGVSIDFTPTDSGPRTAELHIYSSDRETPDFVVHLNGTGVTPEIALQAQLSDLPTGTLLDLGAEPVDSTGEALVVTITNEGTADLVFTDDPVITLAGTHAADFLLDQSMLPTILAPGASADFILRLRPTAIGMRSATLTVANSDLDEADFVLELLGTGLAPLLSVADALTDTLVVSGQQVPFGEIGVGELSPAHTLKITNTGNATLHFLTDPAVLLTGPGADGFVVEQSELVNPLIPIEQVQLDFFFAPTAAIPYMATLSLATDADTFQLELTGTGIIINAVDDIIDSDAALRVYPNPTTDRLYLHLTDYTPLPDQPYQVWDVHGRVVQQGRLAATSGQLTFSVAHLPPGTYYATLPTEVGLLRARFVKS